MSPSLAANDSLLAFASFALSQSPVTEDEYNSLTELSDSEDSLDSSTEASCTDETCCPPPSKRSLPTLPPEILLLILGHALSTALKEPYILDNQFSHLTTYCRPCLYRSLSLVDRTFRAIAQELFLGEIVLDRKEAGARDDSRLVERVRREGWGSWVRSVDASLRGSNGAVPERGREEERVVTHVEAGERDRERQSERDRSTLLRLLEVTPQLRSLDVDLGFHCSVLRPGILPSSLRSLTLRNAEAADTFALLATLSSLTELTLRLVLDFYLPETSPLLGTPALESFELSITGWGETDTSTILRLLAGSDTSLKRLTLRNKAAVSIPSFLPLSRDLIAKFGPQLESLSVKDIPHHGIRPASETPLSTFFPIKPPLIKCLKELHLAGVPYSPALMGALLGSGASPQLRKLTIEDFDEPSGEPLLACLALPSLRELKLLRVSHSLSWSEEDVIEVWAREREVDLRASWRLRRFSRRWW